MKNQRSHSTNSPITEEQKKNQKIIEIINDMLELPEEEKEAVCWLVKHIEAVNLMIDGEGKAKDLTPLIKRARENGDHLSLVLLQYTQYIDGQRRGEGGPSFD